MEIPLERLKRRIRSWLDCGSFQVPAYRDILSLLNVVEYIYFPFSNLVQHILCCSQSRCESLLQIKDIGHRILKSIEQEDFDSFGVLMDEHWQNKRKLSAKISYSEVDDLYDLVKKEYGVLGGKIIGAGGGGFLMLYAPKKHRELTSFMQSKGYFRLPYSMEFEGTKIISNARNTQENL